MRTSLGLVAALSAFFVLGPGAEPVTAADPYEPCNKALASCRAPCNKIEDEKLARSCENECLKKSNECALKAAPSVRITRNPKSLASELQHLPTPGAGMKYDSSCLNICITAFNSCVGKANAASPKDSGVVLLECDKQYDNCKRAPKCQVKAK